MWLFTSVTDGKVNGLAMTCPLAATGKCTGSRAMAEEEITGIILAVAGELHKIEAA
eukprot:CAMPEP_0185783376 /NCGR_PEP_ID=MMETSP1174-20130828/116437_1 /TAXON_ID=35687 /ORGANISM="Dictyocha speculum, Strain CCMP1381" /LENGTH=55 /DNA_ID=CAMNT_0028474391 /DNA_START=1 /DNA_END=164 /DNA_ORIENTATION=+